MSKRAQHKANALAGLNPGATYGEPDSIGNENQGNQLSPPREKPIGILRPHPLNDVLFENDPGKISEVRASVENSGIIQPIIAMPSSDSMNPEYATILAGHVRHEVAVDIGKSTVPVRFTRSSLSRKDQLLILIGDNQSAKKPSVALEILRLCHLYSDYFLKGGETVSPPTVAEIAATIGKSERTVQMYRAVIDIALELKSENAEQLNLAHIKAALEKRNGERRSKATDLKKISKAISKELLSLPNKKEKLAFIADLRKVLSSIKKDLDEQ